MSTTEEVQNFVWDADVHGGLAAYLCFCGGDDAPTELETEVANFLAAWDVLKYAYKALLHANDVAL